jgi:hypothetical protein
LLLNKDSVNITNFFRLLYENYSNRKGITDFDKQFRF